MRLCLKVWLWSGFCCLLSMICMAEDMPLVGNLLIPALEVPSDEAELLCLRYTGTGEIAIPGVTEEWLVSLAGAEEAHLVVEYLQDGELWLRARPDAVAGEKELVLTAWNETGAEASCQFRIGLSYANTPPDVRLQDLFFTRGDVGLYMDFAFPLAMGIHSEESITQRLNKNFTQVRMKEDDREFYDMYPDDSFLDQTERLFVRCHVRTFHEEPIPFRVYAEDTGPALDSGHRNRVETEEFFLQCTDVPWFPRLNLPEASLQPGQRLFLVPQSPVKPEAKIVNLSWVDPLPFPRGSAGDYLSGGCLGLVSGQAYEIWTEDLERPGTRVSWGKVQVPEYGLPHAPMVVPTIWSGWSPRISVYAPYSMSVSLHFVSLETGISYDVRDMLMPIVEWYGELRWYMEELPLCGLPPGDYRVTARGKNPLGEGEISEPVVITVQPPKDRRSGSEAWREGFFGLAGGVGEMMVLPGETNCRECFLVYPALAGAEKYFVAVYSSAGGKVFRFETDGCCLRVPELPLIDGKNTAYLWYVEAVDSSGNIVRSDVHSFQLLNDAGTVMVLGWEPDEENRVSLFFSGSMARMSRMDLECMIFDVKRGVWWPEHTRAAGTQLTLENYQEAFPRVSVGDHYWILYRIVDRENPEDALGFQLIDVMY